MDRPFSQDWAHPSAKPIPGVLTRPGPSDDASGAHLHIARSGQGDAEPALRVTAYDERRGSSRLKLSLEGVDLDLQARRRGMPGHLEAHLSSGQVRQILPRLTQAASVTVTVLQGAESGSTMIVRLPGLVAALRAMDQRQGRANTVTALIQPGHLPATHVPPQSALPSVSQPQRRKDPVLTRMPAELTKIVAKADCDEPAGTRPIKAWLDSHILLWGVLCTRGAYRDTYALFIHDVGKRQSRPVDIELPGVPDGRESYNQLTNPSFDAITGILSFSDLGRGMSDCGTSGRLVWDGTQFRALHIAAMPDCRGVPAEDWLVTWRANLR